MWIAEGFACIQFFSVSDVFDGDSIQETKPKLQHLLTDDDTAEAVEASHRSVYLIVYSSSLFDISFSAFERDFHLCLVFLNLMF